MRFHEIGIGLALWANGMVGAAIVESRRREFKHVLLNLTYLALLVFVAWGASVLSPSPGDRVRRPPDAESGSPG